MTNVKEEGFVAVERNGSEKPLMTNHRKNHEDVEKFMKEKNLLPKNGLRQLHHQRRTMESAREVHEQHQEEEKEEEEGKENQFFDQFLSSANSAF